MDVVKEVSSKLAASESKFKGASTEDILEHAGFFDSPEEVFDHIYISDKVEQNAKVIKKIASLTAETLKEFDGSVQNYLLAIHKEVLVLEDGTHVLMTGKPKAA